jgi:general secretion pathway protein A
MSNATGLPVGLMYEEIYGHFGLTRNPFLVSPDPERFYSTAAHDEALLQLVSRIEARQGFLVLTGEAGTGKTIVLRYLLDWLRKYNYPTAYVFHPLLRSADLLEVILEDFGVPCYANSRKELLRALKHWLINRHSSGDCPVILIDEAQALRDKTLRELGALFRLQVQGMRLVQLVLAGQPSLEEKLGEQKLAQLQTRVMYHCKIPALTMPETAGYIASRLTAAGSADSGLFPEESIQEVFDYSRGIPRVINLLCEHALLAAYADRRKVINSSDILRVAQYFDLSGAPQLDKDAVASGTFGRLIPFPHLETAAAEARPHEYRVELISVPGSEAVMGAMEVTAVVSNSVAAVAMLEPEPLVIEPMTALEEFVEPAPAIAETAPILLPEFATSRSSALEICAHEEREAFALELEPIANFTESEPVLPAPELEPIFEAASAEPVVSVVPIPEPLVAVLALEPDTAVKLPEPAVEEPAAVAGATAAPLIEPIETVLASDPSMTVDVPVPAVETPGTVAEVTVTAPEPPPLASAPQSAPAIVVDSPRVPVAPRRATAHGKAPVSKPAVKAPRRARMMAFPRPARVVVVKPRLSVARLAASRKHSVVPMVKRATKRFVEYWRAVGRSLIRDNREFGRQCLIWLQKPMDRSWISVARHRTYHAVSTWLHHS